VLDDFASSKLQVSIQTVRKLGNRSQGRNAGISRATSPLIAITDAGCVPHDDWLEQLVTCYHQQVPDLDSNDSQSSPVVVAGYYQGHARTAFEEAVIPYALVMPDKVNPETFLPATRSMLLPKKVWELVGGFDEQLADNEDYAFAHKIKKISRIVFAPKAIVTWQPRSNVYQFSKMIFRFARGDVQAGLIRPKVVLVFIRYVMLLCLVVILWNYQAYAMLTALLLVGAILYSSWAVAKNRRYVPRGWYWLPVLQIIADVGVLLGSSAGIGKWVARQYLSSKD
jgi:GT2 family glycosyltransferase